MNDKFCSIIIFFILLKRQKNLHKINNYEKNSDKGF